jgi:hypothetical protein
MYGASKLNVVSFTMLEQKVIRPKQLGSEGTIEPLAFVCQTSQGWAQSNLSGSALTAKYSYDDTSRITGVNNAASCIICYTCRCFCMQCPSYERSLNVISKLMPLSAEMPIDISKKTKSRSSYI